MKFFIATIFAAFIAQSVSALPATSSVAAPALATNQAQLDSRITPLGLTCVRGSDGTSLDCYRKFFYNYSVVGHAEGCAPDANHTTIVKHYTDIASLYCIPAAGQPICSVDDAIGAQSLSDYLSCATNCGLAHGASIRCGIATTSGLV